MTTPNIINGTIAITGGAGFIGTNLAKRLIDCGCDVIIIDNLYREGSDQNLKWLIDTYGSKVRFRIADIRDETEMKKIVSEVEFIFHLAAQVAVTSSISQPFEDFDINLRGSMNILENVRKYKPSIPLIYTSTNKVYGQLNDLLLKESATRYIPENENEIAGVDENHTIDFHSPYGCSKGAADQYILDYSRTFGLKTIVFRMSCIYGPHQHGTEDQGWIAHFLINVLDNKQITIYGDGKQVRDVLYIDDLVDAFIFAGQNIEKLSGEVFNVGGGIDNSISLMEFFRFLQSEIGFDGSIQMSSWRKGDQKYYVSKMEKARNLLKWVPKVSYDIGVKHLYTWLESNRKWSGSTTTSVFKESV